MRIIYQRPEGPVSVLVPSSSWVVFYGSIEEYGKKLVPTGLKFKIVDDSDIPPDREFRNAWEADFSTFDGVGS